MKPQIRAPYFEIGSKNYIYGDKVLDYALAADKAAEKYDIDVLFITTPVEIRWVAENTRHLIVLAPYMDTLRPGRGMADILPEALKAAGAASGIMNAEDPLAIIGRNGTRVIDDGEADLGEFGRIHYIDWDQTSARTKTVDMMIIEE